MTAREVYDAILIEINKTDTPDILLEDFNYLFNKAINQYVNKAYNKYDINQQSTDDLRVLKATSLLSPVKCSSYGLLSDIGRMMGATYEVILPQDYLHILNCICIYKVNKTTKCYNKGDIWRRKAEKLTADKYSQILDNMWLKPTYKRPYYYIHNVNLGVDRLIQPTDPRRKWGEFDNSKQFYVGLIEPTEENYETLLSQYGRPYLNNEIEYVVNGSLMGEYTYFIIPTTSTLEVKDKSTGWTILTEEMTEVSNYKFYKTVGTGSGSILVSATGGETSEGVSLEGSKILIGTDFQEGGLSTKINVHNNYETILGEDISLGTDAFGNNIYEIKEDLGVPHSMIINNNGNYENASLVQKTAQVRYGNSSQVRMEIRYGR